MQMQMQIQIQIQMQIQIQSIQSYQYLPSKVSHAQTRYEHGKAEKRMA